MWGWGMGESEYLETLAGPRVDREDERYFEAVDGLHHPAQTLSIIHVFRAVERQQAVRFWFQLQAIHNRGTFTGKRQEHEKRIPHHVSDVANSAPDALTV